MTTPSPAATTVGQSPPRQAVNTLTTQKKRSRVEVSWSRSAQESADASATATRASTKAVVPFTARDSSGAAEGGAGVTGSSWDACSSWECGEISLTRLERHGIVRGGGSSHP